MHELKVWGCHIEEKIDKHVLNLNSRTEDGYYMGTTVTKVSIKYSQPQDSITIKYCVTSTFDEYNTISTDGKLSLG